MECARACKRDDDIDCAEPRNGRGSDCLKQRDNVEPPNAAEGSKVKFKQQQHQQQRKRLNGKGDEFDGVERMRICKQQIPSPSKPQQQSTPVRRTQRRIPRLYSPPKEHTFRVFTRSQSASEAFAAACPSKRSLRVAQRLANEEPPAPPLKLPKLHLALSRKEIQEDWMKITGHKYSGKPKKSTLVQRGLGLCNSLTCPSSIRYLNDPQSVFSFLFLLFLFLLLGL